MVGASLQTLVSAHSRGLPAQKLIARFSARPSAASAVSGPHAPAATASAIAAAPAANAMADVTNGAKRISVFAASPPREPRVAIERM